MNFECRTPNFEFRTFVCDIHYSIFPECLCSIRTLTIHYLLRGAGKKKRSAIPSAAGAKVVDVVSGRNDRQVVLDENDRMALVNQPVESVQEDTDVGLV